MLRPRRSGSELRELVAVVGGMAPREEEFRATPPGGAYGCGKIASIRGPVRGQEHLVRRVTNHGQTLQTDSLFLDILHRLKAVDSLGR